jgi:hypothetical protein
MGRASPQKQVGHSLQAAFEWLSTGEGDRADFLYAGLAHWSHDSFQPESSWDSKGFSSIPPASGGRGEAFFLPLLRGSSALCLPLSLWRGREIQGKSGPD